MDTETYLRVTIISWYIFGDFGSIITLCVLMIISDLYIDTVKDLQILMFGNNVESYKYTHPLSMHASIGQDRGEGIARILFPLDDHYRQVPHGCEISALSLAV